ncbi:hypothetical protein P4679_33230 [Priestia megaterium]|uniref:hypothetical protein n=1 Tax=Priestia megaterium TaxID=1404 RepID=UPI002E1F2D59|nr:hypothetical protein [Priestia megaterium]
MNTEQEISVATEPLREIRSRELAGRLKIADSTLRKYSSLLEKHGYTFKREPDNNNGRLYSDQDIALLLEMKEIIDDLNQKPIMAASIALSRRVDFSPNSPAAQDGTPTVPKVSEEVVLAKFEQRMQSYLEDIMTVEEGKKITEGIERFVEATQEVSRKKDEEIKLLKQRNEMLEEALKKEKKKSFLQRLFGG